jgi:hypothetical protein
MNLVAALVALTMTMLEENLVAKCDGECRVRRQGTRNRGNPNRQPCSLPLSLSVLGSRYYMEGRAKEAPMTLMLEHSIPTAPSSDPATQFDIGPSLARSARNNLRNENVGMSDDRAIVIVVSVDG